MLRRQSASVKHANTRGEQTKVLPPFSTTNTKKENGAKKNARKGSLVDSALASGKLE